MSALLVEAETCTPETFRAPDYLHYASRANPYRPALCGVPAPAGGWWSDVLTEAAAVIEAWEVCPVCKHRYHALRARSAR